MANDKLPEEMQGQINNEAYGHVKGLSIEHSKAHQKAGYISGATAWAHWKVKHDELQAQAQRLADALEMTIRHAKECEELYNISGDAVIESAEAVLQQFKDGKEVGEQVEAKEGIIRVILAGAYEVSKDAESAEEYLKSEGVDVAQLKANAQYFIWKADLIRITKEKTGESVVKINDEEAVKWYNDGFTPEQTFRETWQSDGD